MNDASFPCLATTRSWEDPAQPHSNAEGIPGPAFLAGQGSAERPLVSVAPACSVCLYIGGRKQGNTARCEESSCGEGRTQWREQIHSADCVN